LLDPNQERQRSIYAREAVRYDALVSAEDCEGNILRTIEKVTDIEGARVVDVGGGTGRMARLLSPRVRGGVVTDREVAMIRAAKRLVAGEGGDRWTLAVGDACSLPLRDGVMDIACAGWVFGHFPFWEPSRWVDRVDRALQEMVRVVRVGGTLLVLETLGTATEKAAPPNEGLAAYYERLETRHGFERIVFRTDYRFSSPSEAMNLCSFFFGPECAARVREMGSARIPEHTGLWWKRLKAPDDAP